MNARRVTVAVIGLGGMGSAALYHLASRGVRAIGYERFTAAHDKGASHGSTRIIRQAYYEDASYVPLLRRAYELWDELNRTSQANIWTICGGVTFGKPDAPLVAGALHAARLHGVSHEVLDAKAARARFPEFSFGDDEIAIFEPTVGALFPEVCVAEHLRQAQQLGAEIHFGAPAPAIDELPCDRVIVCPGAWVRNFADVPVRIERNVQHWFAPPEANDPRHIFMVQREQWPRLLYGFPDLGEGVKAAFHGSGTFIGSPGDHDIRAAAPEIEAVRSALMQTLSGGAGEHVRSDPCMYALTPDEHFIVGNMPGRSAVILAAGFSGHGFKFCSVMGEILADLTLEGATRHDISLFDPQRFQTKKPSSS